MAYLFNYIDLQRIAQLNWIISRSRVLQKTGESQEIRYVWDIRAGDKLNSSGRCQSKEQKRPAIVRSNATIRNCKRTESMRADCTELRQLLWQTVFYLSRLSSHARFMRTSSIKNRTP